MGKKNFSRKLTALLLAAVMMLPLAGCSDDKPVQKQVFAMDTVMVLTAYGKNAEAGLTAAEGVIKTIDSKLNTDSTDGYTYAINNASGNDVIVSAQVAKMLQTAYDVYEKSDGALDLSVYPIYEAWGEFKEETGRIPDNEELAELLKLLNFGSMSITQFPGETNYSVRFPMGTQISFGAAAKGFASGCAVQAMKDAGVESGLVSLGGNVQTLGVKPDGSNWTIAVEDPHDTGNYVGTLSVGETAVITSGNYQRYFEDKDGVRYHHIIDPKTGYPANSDLVSVTIVCSDGTLADCLSTAMFVLGKDKALKYWRDNGGFEMIMITSDNEVICTSGLVEVFELTNTANYTKTITE